MRRDDSLPTYSGIVRGATSDPPAGPATAVRRDRSGRWWCWVIYGSDGTVRRSYSGYLTRQAAEVMLAKAIEGGRRE